ncbi:pleckstrin homology domain-containing family O member 2 [Brienomyrus brachyistius]|uniref:pleckstrin homology domain-containing family O member 2 n=1 Tax=Brienomyrus brachyistius TaxID=42636 RepID=UPI0020B279B1|nr:pleckstrin homology domain-containing family O member 2 [Brienomyrus brachyistius]
MMEDGVEWNSGSPGKAGWLKKCSGKFLGVYKDCYVQLERAEIGIYKNEDLQKCVERLPLENYEKCHELKSTFKKKNRLVLMRSPRSGNKVHDVKLQAQTPEEKEAWIKALSDAINGMKNNIFDEVKVEGRSLEHVTLTRPKGNQNRRPPTRIHLREGANVKSNGIMDSTSDTHRTATDGVTPEYSVKPPKPPCKSTETSKHNPDEEESPQHRLLKVDNALELIPEEEPLQQVTLDSGGDTKNQIDLTPHLPHKELKPPMPPSKNKKPSPVVEEEKMSYSDEQDASVETSSSSEEMAATLKSTPITPKKPVMHSDWKAVQAGVEWSAKGDSPGLNSASVPSSQETVKEHLLHLSEKLEKGAIKSASMGDLLSKVEDEEENVESFSITSLRNVIGELRSKVSQEVENTKKLLSTVSPREDGQLMGETSADSPQAELLAKALEKLQRADQFLREAESFEEFKSMEKNNKRTSW